MIKSITAKNSDVKRPFSSANLVAALATASLVLATIYAHIRISGSEEYTGPLALLDHIFDLTLALSLSILMLSVGNAVSKRLKLGFASIAEQICFSIFLGTGVVGLSILCLGLLGLLRPWPTLTLLSIYILITVRDLPELYRAIWAGAKRVLLTREARVIASLVLFLVAIFILRAATPPNTPDELIYHLPVIRQFVQQGRVSPFYDNFFGNLPFLINMTYALCLMASSDIAARLFSLFLALFTGLALYAFCCRFLTRRVGVIAIFAFFGAGMVVEVAVTARIDVSLAGMLFVATYAMLNYLETEMLGWLWVSAILAGFSLGIKSSAGPWVLFLGVVFLVERLIIKREHFTSILKHGVTYTLIAAVFACPWYIKNYVWFHNPVYPFFTGEVADFGPQGVRYFNAEDERKLDAHFAEARKEIPEIVNAQENEIRQAIGSRLTRRPMRLWEFFTKPEAYLVSEPFHLPNYLFLLTPLVLFLKPGRRILWLLGLSIAFAFSVTWSSWIARYLLPVYPALAIVTAYTLVALSGRLSQRIRFAERLPAWAAAISLCLVVVISLVWISEFNSLGFLSGSISRRGFLIQFPFYHRIDFINTQLPSGARVLAIGAHMNYGIHREYTTDESWFATKWRRLLVRNDSLDEVSQDLHRQGFSHILYCSGPFIYSATMGIKGSGGMDLVSRKDVRLSQTARTWGPEYELLRNWSTFTLYREKSLQTVYTDESGCEVLQIK